MYLVEMPECVGQLGKHCSAVAVVYAADVITFERVHEALGRAVRLGAVDRGMHRFNAPNIIALS
jgi:hypothetical protein